MTIRKAVTEDLVRLERSSDYELIRQIMTHPRVYPSITDDFSVPAEEFHPIENDGLIYVIARIDGEPVGAMLGVPENGIELRVHHYLLPETWGNVAAYVVESALDWLWKNTGYKRVLGKTPAFNRLALKFAMKMGMEVIGIDRQSIQKHGRLWDQFIFGMSRPGRNGNGN